MSFMPHTYISMDLFDAKNHVLSKEEVSHLH